MPSGDCVSSPGKVSLSVVLYAERNGDPTLEAIDEATGKLNHLALDYEILVIGEDGQASIAQAANVQRSTLNVERSTGGYAGVLRAGLAASRCSHIAFVKIGADLSALTLLMPLIERHSVVCGTHLAKCGSLLNRTLTWAYNSLAKTLLDTRVRDCEGSAVISVFGRSTLAEILPESDGRFAHAELLARARQSNCSVAEVSLYPAICSVRQPTWKYRDFPRAFAALVRFWWSRVQFPARPWQEAAGAGLPVSRASWIFGVFVAVLAALLLFSDLNQPLLDPDEGRQAEIPREMLAHDDLLLPRMLGVPYYDKPPLQYWLTAGAYTVFGVRPWVARLVPTIAAWLTLLLAYAWAQRALAVRAAFLGGLGLCLAPGFVVLGRTVILDSLLTVCVAASWFSAHAAIGLCQRGRLGGADTPACRGPQALRWFWWLFSAFACGLGLLAKGPVALLLILPPVLAYQLLMPTAARPRWASWLAYVGLAVLVAAPWYTAMALSEPDYLEHFFWKAHVVRFVNPYDHEQPWWFYVPILFGFTFPWSLFWPALVYFLLSRRRRIAMLRSHGLGFCVLILGWCLLFYSLSGCKSPPYVAPALVPLALLLGACLDCRLQIADSRFKSRRSAALAFLSICSLKSAICNLLGGFAPARVWDSARQVLPRRVTLLMLLLSAGCYLATALLGWQDWWLVLAELTVTLGLAGAWWHYGRRASPALAWGACAVATLAFNLLAVQDLVAGFASRHSPASVARLVRRWPGGADYPVVAYARQWPSASFYLRRDLVAFCDQTQLPSLIALMKKSPQVLVLVESGPPLDDLLHALPNSLQAEVLRPQREGQVALLVVRHRGRD